MARPVQEIIRLGLGFIVSQALRVVVELEIADRLAQGERSVDELAQECGVDPDSLYRIMRVLAAEGVFREESPRRFTLTDIGAALRRDAAMTPRDFVSVMNSEAYIALEQLMEAVRTGKPAFAKVFGKPRFDWLDDHPDKAALFQRAMAGFAQGRHEAVVDAYDFKPFSKVVDVGGAHGHLVAAILERNPNLRGILFDRPASIAAAAGTPIGRMPRLELIGGDFFESVPAGGDVYVMKKVIHDWSDEQAVAIFRNCRKAIAQGGRLLLVETIMPAGNDRAQIKLVDALMLAVTGGRERREDEYGVLLGEAGFALQRVIPTSEATSIVEARPV